MTQSRMPDVEWLAVEHRVKPAMRVTISPDRAADFEVRLARKGFAFVRAQGLAHLPGRDTQTIIYVAHDAARAQALREAESTILPGGPPAPFTDATRDAHRRLGSLLGYPACCVDAFVDRLSRGVTRRPNGAHANEDFVAAEDAASRTQVFHARLNNLLFDRQARLLSCYPCRYDCPTALAYADAVHAVLLRASPEGTKALVEALTVRVQLTPDGRRQTGPEPLPGAELVLDFSQF